MIYHFVLNPMSGKNLKKEKKNVEIMTEKIRNACRSRQLSYRIYYTVSRGDATDYVKAMINSSQDRQRFICVGGDGTINEIVNSSPSNDNVEFGVIPCGSGNDFVKNFTNVDNFYDIDAQLDGQPVSLDLIKCNDRYCVNMVNIGFDCSVVIEADKLKKRKLVTPGISYIGGVVVALFKKYGTHMRLIFDDGEVIDSELLLTAIGNGKFCGGGFCATPEALLQDGLMDIAVINKVSRLTFINLVGSYKAGTYLTSEKAMKCINYKRLPHFRMEFDKVIPICIDGEIIEADSLEFTVVKKAFNFVIPKGSEMKYKFEEKINECV